MRAVEKRYHREFFPAIFAYVVVLLSTTWILKHLLGDAGSWVRGVVALLPVVPIGFVARAIVRVIRDNDELQRRIDLEAVAVASLVVGMIYFTLGLLAAADVIAVAGDVAMIWVLPALCGAFGVAKFWSSRRFQ